MMDLLDHSPLGGSGAHRFMTCTGSFLLHRQQLLTGEFENVESEFAKLGSAAHLLGSTCLTNGEEPYEYVGENIGGYLVGVDIELDAVSVYTNHCNAIAARDPSALVNIEKTLRKPEVHPLLKGTLDFDCYSRKLGFDVVDYKNGEGIGVAAPNNRQLLYYGFLKLLNLPMDVHGGSHTTTPMRLGIVQPNFYGVFEEPDTWETTAGFVWEWGNDELLPTMHRLTDAQEITEDDFVTGEHCQFCPVMLDCPKMQRAFRRYAAGEEDFVAMLTDEEISDLYGERENARRFMKTLETVAHARLVTGRPITTGKLVEKKTARVWKPGATAALKAAFGEKAYKPQEIISPAAAEKLSSRGKELALEYGYKPDANGLTIAPLSDPRPQAKPVGNATVFAAFEKTPVEEGF